MVRRRTGLERDSHLSSDPREEGSGPRVAHSNLALWCPGSISIEVAQKSFLSVEEKPRLLPLGHKGTPSLRGTTLSLPRWQTVMLEMSSEDLSSENDPSKSPRAPTNANFLFPQCSHPEYQLLSFHIETSCPLYPHSILVFRPDISISHQQASSFAGNFFSQWAPAR